MSSARDLRRIATIGDSVFAVVVTLMAHRVRIPDIDMIRAGTIVPLIPFLTDLLAVVMSFFVASMFWLAHWRIFRRLRRADVAFVASNLAFLGTLVLLPISTRIMSSYWMTTTGTAIYSANLFLAALMQLFFRQQAQRVDPAAFPDSRLMLVPVMMMTIFGTAGVVGLYWPHLSPWIWCTAFLARTVDRRWGLGPERSAATPLAASGG